jgi:ATP-dependent DNA helicase PIF1
MVKNKSIEINEQFQRALDLMEKTNRQVFITGKAGTGKSTLLEYFRKNTKKKVAVLAPTGVAALNVQGQTIHSFCGFKPNISLENVKKMARKDSPRATLYRNLDTLVIDEISMVRADLLDCVEKFLRLNGPRSSRPFGGIQMILIGDLYQLPPVLTSAEKTAFSLHYETPYFFSAQVLNDPEFNLELVELEKIYRQTDSDFIGLLNAIRNRSADEDDLTRLNRNCHPAFIPPENEFYVYLTSTNDQAFTRNREKLGRLPGKSCTYEAMAQGDFERSAYPTDEQLEVKRGAQVMLLTNDSLGRWVNGSIGRVVRIHRQGDGEDRIEVELPSGRRVEVTPFRWQIFRFDYDEAAKRIFSEPVGSFTQYPLKLAWAITIHKSQGKTFDKVVVDIGRGTFAHGQMYVALSRCTSFEGLILIQPIRKQHILMDYRVVNFLTRFQYRKAEERLSYQEKTRLVREAIAQKEDLEIVYLKPDDTKSRRRIRPEALGPMEYQGKPFEGLRAYCYERKGARTFRLDRMLDINRPG